MSQPPTPRFSAAAAPISRPLPLAILYPLLFVAVYLSHWTLLRLPYFWDEAGYYIPAALDFFRTGALVPTSTITNAHPPLPSVVLALWWHLSGFVPMATRTLVCLFAAAALLAVYRLARTLASWHVAAAVTLLTALYPVWFTQSTLAHADIFAATFTLWGLSSYFRPQRESQQGKNAVDIAVLFTLAALSKETAIVTPVALALWELARSPRRAARVLPLLFPVLPLALWYAYHFHHTGFIFGNPEFLRYNATANLSPLRILLSLWHRIIHLTLHMNMYVPMLCTVAVLLMPPLTDRESAPVFSRPVLTAILVVLVANTLALSVLGGALLTRYLLPLYPLILLLCVAVWRQRFRRWPWLAALAAVAFIAAQRINPPYSFAPEDNLSYRDMIVLHQQAIAVIAKRFPQATVLTAWPATAELTHPELGYTRVAIRSTPLENFSIEQVQRADPSTFDTALLFSTKLTPPASRLSLSRPNESSDARFFDFHRDVSPAEAAALLHGEIVWQRTQGAEWAAVLHFPRIVEASSKHFSP